MYDQVDIVELFFIELSMYNILSSLLGQKGYQVVL